MTNIIQFPGTRPETTQEEDDFCGAAGVLFEGCSAQAPLPQSDVDSMELYRFENQIMNRLQILLGFEGKDQASVSFPEPEALSEEFKRVLLKVLARNKKASHRNGRVLTVSHPEMTRDEQVPFLKEISKVPQITVRAATPETLEMMYLLRHSFQELIDARNAIQSEKRETTPPYFF